MKNGYFALDLGHSIWVLADLFTNTCERHTGKIWLAYLGSEVINVSWIFARFSKESEHVASAIDQRTASLGQDNMSEHIVGFNSPSIFFIAAFAVRDPI